MNVSRLATLHFISVLSLTIYGQAAIYSSSISTRHAPAASLYMRDYTRFCQNSVDCCVSRAAKHMKSVPCQKRQQQVRSTVTANVIWFACGKASCGASPSVPFLALTLYCIGAAPSASGLGGMTPFHAHFGLNRMPSCSVLPCVHGLTCLVSFRM